MAIVFEKTRLLTDKPFHYCPGCTQDVYKRQEGGERQRLQRRFAGELWQARVGHAVADDQYILCLLYTSYPPEGRQDR